MSLKCKVLVRVVVQVERDFYGEYEDPVDKMFKIVAADAVGQVLRKLDDVATIVGTPTVYSITTVEREAPLPKEPAA